MKEGRAGSAPPALLVVDTNVVVAGLITAEAGAPTALLVDAMLAGRICYLLSVELLAEYRAVLLRPRIAALHGLSEADVDEILVRLASAAIVREPPGSPFGTRGDRHVEALLEAEPGALLVSGDARLLARVKPRGRSPGELVAERPGLRRP